MKNKRNFRNIVEHMLSYLRADEKFEQAHKLLKRVYDILAGLNLELVEIELIVLSWCKIKRDLSRQKNDQLKKYTAVDYFSVRADLAYQYLFEELKTYAIFRFKKKKTLTVC